MNVSVVLATYKRSEILKSTLESFSHMVCGDLKWELLVVDNAGDDATEQLVIGWVGKLPIHYLVELKSGKNNALNTALPHASGELLVFTDDDIIANPDWLVQLWEGAARWPSHSVFGGRILPSWPEGYAPLNTSEPFMSNAYAIADWAFPEGEYPPKNVFGANMAVRSAVFNNGVCFDTSVGPSQNVNYVMGSETEFLLRLHQVGYRPIYLPNALVYHQIRSEQMSFDWIKKRAYRAGRGAEYADRSSSCGKKIFDFPVYLIRKSIELSILYFIFTVFNRISKKTYGIKLYYLLGRLSVYRQDR